MTGARVGEARELPTGVLTAAFAACHRLFLAVRRRDARARVSQPQGALMRAAPPGGALLTAPICAMQSGHSRHYGWVEFKHPAVARVAAEAMDNYLMFGQVLRVRVVPPAQVHPSTFKGAGRPVRPRPGARLAREAHNAKRSEEQLHRAAGRLLRGERKRRSKIAAAGIEYDFAGYAGAAPPAAEAKAPKAAAPAKEKAAPAPAAKGKRGAAEAAPEPVEAPSAAAPPAKRAKAAAAPAAEPAAPAARPRRSTCA